MRHMRTEKGSVVFAAALVLSQLSLLLLTLSGFLPEQFEDPRTLEMFAELAVLFPLLFCTDRFVRAPGTRSSLILLELCLFLWIHRIFLPILLSGFWCLCLILAGEDLLLFYRRKNAVTGETAVLRILHDFMTGAALEIVFFCFLSGLHLGGTRNVRFAAICYAGLAILFYLFFRVSHLFPPVFSERAADDAGREAAEAAADPAEPGEARESAENEGSGVSASLFRAAFFTLLAIHAGRMNITLDHDSVHYGLRSFYILDNGRGIFENLGSVNTVYYYPKGLEILTLPLSGTPTYGFVLAFSFWCAVLFLFLMRDTAEAHFGKKAGNCAMLLAAAIPGIMNLSTSAKTDMITLLFQFLAVSDLLNAVREERGERRTESVLWSLASLAFTLCFKPTAIAFSGILFLSGAVFLAVQRKRTGISFRLSRAGSMIPALLLVLLALVGVTLRTIHLTGYPLVTVFTGIWEKLGMHGKYPLAVQSVPNASAGGSAAENLLFFLRRLFEILIAPVGEDALHIRIAWGAPLVPACLVAAVCAPGGKRGRRKERCGTGPDAVSSCLGFTLAALLLFDAVTLCLLYQVDGNYYNLTYALTVLYAVSCWKKRTHTLMRCVFPAFLASAFFTCVTNWAGARGFTEPRLNHYGFYDHVSDTVDRMILTAKEPIYRYLHNAARIRLLAMSAEPECYLFPCCVESYTDLEGSGGNVALVKTLNTFKDYLETAGITYLYTEDAFLADHSRAEEIIRYMQEDGSIIPVIRQEGNTLYEYQAGIRD